MKKPRKHEGLVLLLQASKFLKWWMSREKESREMREVCGYVLEF